MSPVQAQPEILDIFILGELHIVYMNGGVRFISCGECDVDRLGSITFYSPFLNQFSIAASLVFSTAVSSTKVALVDSGQAGRSAVYSRNNNGPRALPCGTPDLAVESSVFSVSTFYEKVSAMKIVF
jgi:hypothetical protein